MELADVEEKFSTDDNALSIKPKLKRRKIAAIF